MKEKIVLGIALVFGIIGTYGRFTTPEVRVEVPVEKKVYDNEKVRKCIEQGGEYSAIINENEDWQRCKVVKTIDLSE